MDSANAEFHWFVVSIIEGRALCYSYVIDEMSSLFNWFQECLTYPLHSPRFEEEERLRKYLQGQRRQGLDKVTRKIARALGYSFCQNLARLPP